MVNYGWTNLTNYDDIIPYIVLCKCIDKPCLFAKCSISSSSRMHCPQDCLYWCETMSIKKLQNVLKYFCVIFVGIIHAFSVNPTISFIITTKSGSFTDLLRGGVKLEFVRNSFDSIQKLTIRLIRKGKKSSKNSIFFNSKFVRFKRKWFEKFANFSNSVFWFEKFDKTFS